MQVVLLDLTSLLAALHVLGLSTLGTAHILPASRGLYSIVESRTRTYRCSDDSPTTDFPGSNLTGDPATKRFLASAPEDVRYSFGLLSLVKSGTRQRPQAWDSIVS